MVLAVGVVVDDAIVVVENVERVMEEEPDLPPAEATRKAMRQITGPIIAISLVLLSVFVPVGFIPGLSGTLFRQFAVTMSCAMLISAINALTLSPALCAVFLRHQGKRRGAIGRVLRGIDNARDGYAWVVQRVVRLAALSLLAIALFAAGILFAARTTPTGFLPEEDQGAFFIAVQFPDAASVARTSAVTTRVEQILKRHAADPGHAVDHRIFLAGWRRVGAECRVHGGADEAVRRSRRRGQFGAGAGRPHVRRRAADPVRGDLPVQPAADHRPGHRRRIRIPARGAARPGPVRPMAAVMQGLLAAANQDPRLTRVFSTFTATNPSLYLDIDRDKAQALGLSISDVFTALGATLGGVYVNNFNLYGRTWQVNIEGEPADRSDIPAIWRIFVRNNNGEMVPLRSIASLRIVTGPQVITRYNNYRSITIDGSPAPGVSSGTALAAMAQISDRTLPPGYGFEWTGTAYQEQLAAGQTGLILGLSVLFAYLFLVGLYESWTIPLPVLFSVVVGVLGRLCRHSHRRACRWISTRRSAWWC